MVGGGDGFHIFNVRPIYRAPTAKTNFTRCTVFHGESDFDLSRYYVSLVSFPPTLSHEPRCHRSSVPTLVSSLFSGLNRVRGARFKAVEKR